MPSTSIPTAARPLTNFSTQAAQPRSLESLPVSGVSISIASLGAHAVQNTPGGRQAGRVSDRGQQAKKRNAQLSSRGEGE
eukprot:COSAG04_NODE_1100_length_8253_cov_31.916728_2_plen_80_part_00